ncbi:transposase domain-containing protein [Streptomyces sp. CG1]|uniref:transposase domain-containing protein n=1 Tax=Streptomyces sp. CG1 TaxID=1287523 RepID=UPI0034E23F90
MEQRSSLVQGSRPRQLVPQDAPLPVHWVSTSALTAITRTVTVAEGRFAPGHLGELTPFMPSELVDAVLSEARTVQRRLRDLPSQVGVCLLLAMCPFPRSAIGWSGTSGPQPAGDADRLPEHESAT